MDSIVRKLYCHVYHASIHHFGSNQAARYNLLNGVSINMTEYCRFRQIPHSDSIKIACLRVKNMVVAENHIKEKFLS